MGHIYLGMGVNMMKKNLNYNLGDVLVCVSSGSPAYKLHSVYKVVENNLGVKGLIGEDGLFDAMSMLVSQFKLKSEKGIVNELVGEAQGS